MVKRPAKKTATKRAARKPAAPKQQGRARITEQMVLDSLRRPAAAAPMIPAADIFKPYQHPKSVYGDQHKAPTMAMDDAGSYGAQAWATNNPGLVMHEGLAFFGYAILAEMTQRPEYRRISEVIATEMTREWITLKSKGEADKSEVISELNDDIAKFGVKALFKEAAEQDGFFGRSHIFPDFGISEKQNGELKTPITDAEGKLASSKIKKGTLRKLKCIEPVWIAPMGYNTTNPLADDWYRPTTWLVQGIEVHHTRLVTFIGREVPDILKPAYSFGGLPMSQIAKPYVDNWLQTRSNVNQLIGNFSIVVFGTNLLPQSGFGGADSSSTAASDLGNRMQMFANYRRNNGAALIDKATEELQSLAVPLGTLDALQAQSQEQMCSVTGIPVVKLLGIQPAGLNASSEGEITSFYDSIKAYQQALFAGNLTYILQILMMNRYGKVDEDIIFEFNSLERATPHEMAEMRRLDAETGAILIDSNVITAKEERARLQADPTGVYTNLEENTPQEVMGDLDKANSAANLTAAVMSVHESNLISDKQALTELAAMSKTTGLWTSIKPEDIEAADDEPPEPAESPASLPGAIPSPINGRGGQPPGKPGRAAAPQAPAPRAQQ